LKDAVGNERKAGGEDQQIYLNEYLVIFENFVELAKEYGLKLVEKKNLLEWYDES
jgi:hypothetical protein